MGFLNNIKTNLREELNQGVSKVAAKVSQVVQKKDNNSSEGEIYYR